MLHILDATALFSIDIGEVEGENLSFVLVIARKPIG
jgi:hypothetical protein